MPARHLVAQASRLPLCNALYLLRRGAGTANTHRSILPLNPSHPSPSLPSESRKASSSSSSSSSTRWLARQSSDPHTRASKLSALKSRAAFKLLEINARHRLFRAGQTVVDLGYAPGSWSQVARARVGSAGRVVGIDLIPAQPPRGVSAMQGNFLSASVQARVREWVRDEGMGRGGAVTGGVVEGVRAAATAAEEEAEEPVDHEEDEAVVAVETEGKEERKDKKKERKRSSQREQDAAEGRVVDVVLSDMCAPWPLEISTWIRSVNNPYRRMMNTSGNPFRDHAGSMDLSLAALTFAHDTLVTGGSFLCKFYQGPEDKAFEMRLKKLFDKVHRIKPDSSRKESRESYFVGLGRKASVEKGDVVGGELA